MRQQLRIVRAVLMAAVCVPLSQVAVATLSQVAVATPLTVFIYDFDNPPFVYPGVVALYGGAGATAESVQGYANVTGFSGKFVWQPQCCSQGSGMNSGGQYQLLLSNLPPHDSVDVNFLLAIIDSWDGPNTADMRDPDFFNVVIDRTIVFSDEFAFFSSPGVYAAPPGGKLTAGPPYPQLAFNPNHPDQAYNMGLEPRLTIPHTSSSLFIQLYAGGAGYGYEQGVFDESWAMDNFEVVIHQAPETSVKAVHIAELRTQINWRRTRCGLSAFSFTDSELSGTVIKAVHLSELRSALNEAYMACGQSPPTYTDPTLTVGFTVIKAVHINELRNAVLALE